jgi:hypothetical protein
MSASGGKSVLGVKVRVVPCACQEPAVEGSRVGRAEIFDSGEVKVTVMGAVGETPVVPFAGTIERTLSVGGARLAGPG